MTIPFHEGRYRVRFATDPSDVLACQHLRHRCFFGAAGVDADRFDPMCRHLMVTGREGRLVATVRLLEMNSGADVAHGYAAQSYDLAGLAAVRAPMIEIGRFCVAPDALDADVLRVTWGALTKLVDARCVSMLFGCTSFPGVDPAPYSRVFARLASRHLGPDHLRPRPKAATAVHFADMCGQGTDPMPSMLRTYLAMGGWVGDHVVVDPAMNTMHLFTCIEVAAVPLARARALRALAPAHALP